VGEGSRERPAAPPPPYLMTHDLVYTKNGRIVKTHSEVEDVLSRHHWKLKNQAAPVNEWVEYVYEPPNSTMRDESRPLARLPAPSLPKVDAVNESTPRCPRCPPAPDDWKLGSLHASMDAVYQFAKRVNIVTGDELFLVQEKPDSWLRVQAEHATHPC
jgi:hypothetical protein